MRWAIVMVAYAFVALSMDQPWFIVLAPVLFIAWMGGPVVLMALAGHCWQAIFLPPPPGHSPSQSTQSAYPPSTHKLDCQSALIDTAPCPKPSRQLPQ
jgi:hypothetical protein